MTIGVQVNSSSPFWRQVRPDSQAPRIMPTQGEQADVASAGEGHHLAECSLEVGRGGEDARVGGLNVLGLGPGVLHDGGREQDAVNIANLRQRDADADTAYVTDSPCANVRGRVGVRERSSVRQQSDCG
jgi:hypothetical protein